MTSAVMMGAGKKNKWGNWMFAIDVNLRRFFTITLMFAVVLGVGCSPIINQTPTANAGKDLVVMVGAVVTLDGRASSGPQGTTLAYSWEQTMGPIVELRQSKTATPKFTAPLDITTLAFTLTVKANERASRPDSVMVKVSQNVPPTILSFSADPSSIQPGESTTLRWNVSGSTACRIDQGIGEVPAEGSRIVSPLKTTTYTFTAVNAHGNVTAKTIVTVLGDSSSPVVEPFFDASLAPLDASVSLVDANVSDTTLPSTPTGLVASKLTSRSFTLTWQASTDSDTGVAGYEVRQDGAVVGTPTTPSFNLVNLTANTSYVMTVKAKDGAGNWSIESAALHVKTIPVQDSNFRVETVTAESSINPWEKALADINGDGFLDVIIGAPTGPVIWYAYPTWVPTTIAGDGTYNSACGIATGDIDTDGDIDVVMGGNVWFENPRLGGTELAKTWTSHFVGEQAAHDLVVADLDGDHRLEIIGREQNEGGKTILIFKQTSNGTWTSRKLTAEPGEGLTVGDFDSDGDLDIAIPRQWYENSGITGPWTTHSVNPSFDPVSVIKAGDLNKDGRSDLLLSASENTGPLVWMECPPGGQGTWTAHTIATELTSTHGIGIGDFDQDGDEDVVASEFSESGQLVYYNNVDGLGTQWKPKTLGTQRLHNIQVGDVENDGDIDILGAYCWGSVPVLVYFNENATKPASLGDFTYIQVDDDRTGNMFGLGMADCTGDGKLDIASGGFFYRNPGGNLLGTWNRATLPLGDANAILDVDGDDRCDILSQALPDILWYEAEDVPGSSFTSKTVATGIPATDHGSSQGYAVGEIMGGGKPEFVFTSGDGIYVVQIPANPSQGNWPKLKVTANAPEEGLALGDVDGDGKLDIVAWVGSGSSSTTLGWWKNPGTGAENWVGYELGTVNEGFEGDRVATADLDGDHRLDVIATDTNNGESGNSVYWFVGPVNPAKSIPWTRRTIGTNLGAMNSMDVADMDGDGDIDVVTGEHRGPKRVTIWENVSKAASFTAHEISKGRENHLGTRIADLDGDGDLDLVGIAWDEFSFLHIWRNNAK
jgi:hypothetical protein